MPWLSILTQPIELEPLHAQPGAARAREVGALAPIVPDRELGPVRAERAQRNGRIFERAVGAHAVKLDVDAAALVGWQGRVRPDP